MADKKMTEDMMATRAQLMMAPAKTTRSYRTVWRIAQGEGAVRPSDGGRPTVHGRDGWGNLGKR